MEKPSDIERSGKNLCLRRWHLNWDMKGQKEQVMYVKSRESHARSNILLRVVKLLHGVVVLASTFLAKQPLATLKWH